MNLNASYDAAIARLKKGQRVLDKLEPNEITFLKNALTESKNHPEQLQKVLCLIENTRTLTQEFEPGLVALLNETTLSPNLIIYTLNACRKHSIDYRVKVGERISADFLKSLMHLVHHPAPEVVEWTLRVIDECGPQGVFFYKEIKAIKPKFSWIFNKHRRATVQLIDMFHKRWASGPNSENASEPEKS